MPPDIHTRMHYAMVLHDLNNLLQAVMGWLDENLEDCFPCEERLAGARTGMESVVGFLNRQLDILLDDVGPCDERVVRDTLRILGPQVPHGVALRASLPKQGVRMSIGALALQRILLNLVLNALDAVGDEGCVTISLELAGSHVVVDVCDDGAGNGAARPEGRPSRGLGLPSCRSLAEAAGGTVTLREQPGRGMCVRLTVPAALPGR